MTQPYEDFKEQHPEVAEAMETLGMSYEEYLEAQRRREPPRIYTSNSSVGTPAPYLVGWYSNSTVAPKEQYKHVPHQ